MAMDHQAGPAGLPRCYHSPTRAQPLEAGKQRLDGSHQTLGLQTRGSGRLPAPPPADLGHASHPLLHILLANFSHPVARPLRHAKFLAEMSRRWTQMQLTDMIASGMGFRELVWLAMIGAALAQSPEASISGVVTDAQRAVIAGAKVEARNTATGVINAAERNPSGVYSLRFPAIG